MNRTSVTDHAPGRIGISIGDEYEVLPSDEAIEFAEQIIEKAEEARSK